MAGPQANSAIYLLRARTQARFSEIPFSGKDFACTVSELVIGRLVGVDFGRRRIGLAISDPERRIASPAGLIDVAAPGGTPAARVAAWGKAHDATAFVVGLPLNMDGSAGSQAKLCEVFARELATASGLPVELCDERLSSFQADELLNVAALRGRHRATRRDALAAMVILQTFLDQRRAE